MITALTINATPPNLLRNQVVFRGKIALIAFAFGAVNLAMRHAVMGNRWILGPTRTLARAGDTLHCASAASARVGKLRRNCDAQPLDTCPGFVLE